MIDLLMVTISFLLITAVWTSATRVQADAFAPGARGPVAPSDREPRLHLEMGDPNRLVLHWDVGPTVVRTTEVPRSEVVTTDRGARVVRYPALEAALADEWRVEGTHRDPVDRASDEIVLHVANDAPYSSIVGAMDAAYAVKRVCGASLCAAFRVTFATR